MNWRKKPLWIFISVLLIVLSLFWVIALLKDGVFQLIEQGITINLYVAIFSWLLATASVFLIFYSFYNLMKSAGARFPCAHEARELFFTAQLMRHLPGRFLGVAYQIIKANHLAKTSEWIYGNIATILISTYLALSFSAITLITLSHEKSLGTIVILAVLIAPLCMYGAKHLLLRLNSTNRFMQKIFDYSNALPKIIFSKNGLKALAWGVLSWLVYALAWAALGEALPGLSWQQGLILGAMYTLAWAVGYFSLITPSGIGIRELAFSLLASNYPPDILVFVAIAARLGLMLADLILGIYFLIVKSRRTSEQ